MKSIICVEKAERLRYNTIKWFKKLLTQHWQWRIPMDNSAVYFEEDYIFRNNKSITSNNDVALTEFVANAWDAGAHNVAITIPYEERKRSLLKMMESV